MGIWLLVGFRHLTEFFFEVSDLVAQTGRKFELELFGGGVHLFAQLANQVGEVLRGQAGLQDLLVAFVLPRWESSTGTPTVRVAGLAALR